MMNAGQAVAMLTLDRSQYSSGLKSAYQELSGFVDNTQSAGSRLQSLGSAISSVGSTMIKGITIPLVGAGVAVTNFAMEYETSLAKVSTIANTAEMSMAQMSSAVLDLSNQTGISASEIANNVYDAISAGVKTADSVNFVSNSTKLAKAGFAEAGQSLDLLTTIMNSYGLEASEVGRVSDILINTQNVGKLTVADMASVMGKAIPTAKAFGVNLENLSSAYAVMTAKGINSAEATTYINSAMNELGKSGTTASDVVKKMSGKTFPELIKEGKSLGDVFAMMDEYAKKNGKSMVDLWSSSEGAKAAMVLATNAGADFNNVLDSMGDVTGATDTAFKKVSETTKEKLTRSLNELKNSAIKLGTTLLPLANNIVEGISKVVDKFNNLDDATKENIVKFGLFAAAAGPVLSVAGKLVSVTGSLVTAVSSVSSAIGGIGLAGLASGLSAVLIPLAAVGAGFYVWHEAMDVANQKVTKSREEMSLMERVIADMTGKVTYSKDELVAMGLVYEDFNENISTEFQQSVKDMTTDIHEFGMSLGQINLDEVISEEEHNQFVSKVDGALQSAVQAIDAKSAEMQSGLRGAFSVDGVIDDNESALLEWWASRGTKEKEEAQKLRDEIAQIEANAFAEGRALTGEEIAAIEQRYAQIRQIELEAQANNSYEIEYAHQEFQNRMSTLDAEGAQALLQQRAQQRDEEQIQIRTNYDTLIAMAQENYDTLSAEDKLRADDTIARLQEAKQKELDLSDSYYEQDYQYAIEHNENLKDVINKFTGEILSQKDAKYYQELVRATEHYEGINNVTESGYKKMYNSTTKTWDDVYIKVDSATGQLEGVYDLNSQKVGTMTEKNGKLLRDEVAAWQQTSEGILASCIVSGNATVDAQGTITDAWGTVIGKLVDVQDENGNTVSSIQDVNGTPIDIGENTQEVIDKLKATQREVDNTDGKEADINVTDNGTAEAVKRNINNIPTYKQVVVGVVGGKYNGSTMYATGTDNAMPGVASVAEYGPELIQSRSGTMTLATGRQLFNMDGGETVYNARQTQEILNGMNTKQTDTKGLEKVVADLGDILRRSINDLSNRVEKIQTGLNLNISEFNNNTDKDVEGLMEEMAFYLERNNLATGRV